MNRHADDPGSTDAYRDAYRRDEIAPGYSGRAHFAALFAIGSLVLAVCLYFARAATAVEWLIVPAALIYANIAEYWGHRLVLHRPTPGLRFVHRRHVLQHHRFFTEHRLSFDSPRDFKAVLFPVALVGFFFIAFGAPLSLIAAAALSPQAGLLAFAAGITYYLAYEAMHFIAHMAPDSWPYRVPVLRAVGRHHHRHHDRALMASKNFNFVFPLGDLMFGTYARPDRSDDLARAPRNG